MNRISRRCSAAWSISAEIFLNATSYRRASSSWRLSWRGHLQGPNTTADDVLDATEFVLPAVEIIDARIEQIDHEARTPRTVIDTISDFAACAGLIPGEYRFKADAIDLRRFGGILTRNGLVEETGLAAGVLNHPAYGVAWLTNRLAEFGEGLAAGEIVLSGSFIRPELDSTRKTLDRSSAAAISSFRVALIRAAEQAGFKQPACPTTLSYSTVVLLLILLQVPMAMAYGPLAATLVELFPTRIRYTSVSFPYHLGNGWVGGLPPSISFAIVASTGHILSGLWYPTTVAIVAAVICALLLKDLAPVERGEPIG
jgi:hypothetical protein